MHMPGLFDGQDLISEAEILHVQTQTQDETELQLQPQTEGQKREHGPHAQTCTGKSTVTGYDLQNKFTTQDMLGLKS